MDQPVDESENRTGIVAAIAESPPAKENNTGLSVAVGILAVIALVAALYVAHAFFVPLLIGILTSYALRPLVDWLKVCHVPRFIGAALVLAGLSGSLFWVAVAVSGQAATMLEKLPDAARQLRYHLIDTRTGTPTVLDNVKEAAKELQAAADAAGVTKTAPSPKLIVAREPEMPSWLRDYVLGQSGLVLSVAAQAPIVLLLAYFLLASGQHFRRKLMQLVGPSLSRKKDAVRILEGISEQVQRYLFANLVANTLVGVGTWLAFLALGMEQAGAWGATAGILHFIPYLGPVLTALASGVVAFLQFGSPLAALAVAGVSLLVAGAIGFGFMTWLQSRFAHVSAPVLFIALLFFGWLWGVWGLLLGAPLVAIAKVVCDHVDSLKPVGELLGS
jgi:predicted PurR-regulated permease PerM